MISNPFSIKQPPRVRLRESWKGKRQRKGCQRKHGSCFRLSTAHMGVRILQHPKEQPLSHIRHNRKSTQA